jgi:transcriptional regulator with XRE-family HTH domain
MIDSMAIGHRIKRAREAAGLTQRQLAAAIGVSDGLVGQWESHRKKPGRENLCRLARAVLVDISTLLSESEMTSRPVSITDPNELLLLRRFRHMSRQQQKNLLELFGMSLNVRREMEKQCEPT